MEEQEPGQWHGNAGELDSGLKEPSKAERLRSDQGLEHRVPVQT